MHVCTTAGSNIGGSSRSLAWSKDSTTWDDGRQDETIIKDVSLHLVLRHAPRSSSICWQTEHKSLITKRSFNQKETFPLSLVTKKYVFKRQDSQTDKRNIVSIFFLPAVFVMHSFIFWGIPFLRLGFLRLRIFSFLTKQCCFFPSIYNSPVSV